MESFSDDKINLIFDIHEGNQSKLSLINLLVIKNIAVNFYHQKLSHNL